MDSTYIYIYVFTYDWISSTWETFSFDMLYSKQMNRKINHGTIEKINYYNIYKNIHDIKFQSKFIKIALNFFLFLFKNTF